MKTYIVVPNGKHFTEYHGKTFSTGAEAMTFAENECDYWNRNVHFTVFAVESVGTTQTIDEAMTERP